MAIITSYYIAHPRICTCWPSGLKSGLSDYGQEINTAESTFAHELFTSAYLYAIRGKRVKGIGSRYKALIVTILGWLAARGERAHALIKKRSARRVCAHTIDWRECHSKTPPPMRPFSIVAATGQFALIGNGARRYVREKELALAWAERGSSYVRIYV